MIVDHYSPPGSVAAWQGTWMWFDGLRPAALGVPGLVFSMIM
jgi:hypothetical protein